MHQVAKGVRARLHCTNLFPSLTIQIPANQPCRSFPSFVPSFCVVVYCNPPSTHPPFPSPLSQLNSTLPKPNQHTNASLNPNPNPPYIQSGLRTGIQKAGPLTQSQSSNSATAFFILVLLTFSVTITKESLLLPLLGF